MSTDLHRRVVAETIGMAVLLSAVVGSGFARMRPADAPAFVVAQLLGRGSVVLLA
jgi:hypothetical protein